MHKSMLRISKSITRPSLVSTNAKSVETTTSQQNSNNQKKMLTLKQIWSNLFSAVRKNPNTKKVMMTTEQILKEIESVPRHHITYTRQDGRTNEYTVAITERHADHIIGYKFQNGESCGIRRFNIDQIGILEPVS